MDKEIAKAAIQFLMRTQLQGQEVPAFTQVIQALEEEVMKPEEPDA